MILKAEILHVPFIKLDPIPIKGWFTCWFTIILMLFCWSFLYSKAIPHQLIHYRQSISILCYRDRFFWQFLYYKTICSFGISSEMHILLRIQWSLLKLISKSALNDSDHRLRIIFKSVVYILLSLPAVLTISYYWNLSSNISNPKSYIRSSPCIYIYLFVYWTNTVVEVRVYVLLLYN